MAAGALGREQGLSSAASATFIYPCNLNRERFPASRPNKQNPLSPPTPVRDGFRAIWRQPSIFFAELAWRWSWGGAAILLTGLALFEYLHTLIVTPTDLMLLRLKHPLAVSRALADIFHGSGPRVVFTCIVLIPALALLWALLGSLGRFATLRALVSRATPDWVSKPGSIPALVGLHVLRIALALAGLLSFLGAAVVASFVSTRKTPHAGLELLLFVPLAILVSAIWSSVNWLLSLAPIFTVHDGEDTFGAIAAALAFTRRRGGKTSAVGFWFGAMHLVAFIVGTTVIMYPLAVASLVPPGITLLLMGVIVLVYFAVADWLYVARLAGYLAIVEWDCSSLREPEAVAPAVIEPPILPKPPDSGKGEILEDEPLFSSRERSLADEDCDEPLMPGFSPGEPLPGR